MKIIGTATLDQGEAQALLARLVDHAASLRGLCLAAEGKAIISPGLSNKGEDIFADIAALEIHIRELEGRIGDTAPAFNFSPSTAVNVSSKQTLTEKILAAKGVAKLADLPRHSPLD